MDEFPGAGSPRYFSFRFRSLEAAQSVKLALDTNTEPNIAGYVLRYGTIRGQTLRTHL